MRVPSYKIPYQPLTHLWERHHEIARRLVAGERPTDIASAMGMTQSRLSIICASPAFRAEVQRKRAIADDGLRDIRGRIEETSVDAMTYLSNIIRGNEKEANPTLRAKCSMDMLDRAGYKPTDKFEGVVAMMTPEDIDELKKRRARVINP